MANEVKSFQQKVEEQKERRLAAMAASLDLTKDQSYCEGEVALAIHKARVGIKAKKATLTERINAKIQEQLALANAINALSEADKSLLGKGKMETEETETGTAKEEAANS
jgi:hypothetical protein